MIEKLKTLGYTDKEVKVYLALLKLGKTSSEPLIREVKLHRQIVYDTLNNHFTKGLATYTFKDKRKSYQATSPEVINQKLREMKEIAKEIVPELKKIQEYSLKTNVSKIYQGKASIKTILFEINEKLSEGDSFNVLGAIDEKFFKITEYYFDTWHKERQKKGIKLRLLTNKSEAEESIKQNKKHKLIEIGISKKEINTPASTWIYKNNIAIIIWEEDPLVIHIESEAAYSAYMDYFNLLWSQSRIQNK